MVRARSQPGEPAERPQERILEQILRRRKVPGEPTQVAQDLGLMHVDQLSEVAGRAPGPRRRHNAGKYPRPPTPALSPFDNAATRRAQGRQEREKPERFLLQPVLSVYNPDVSLV